MERTQNRRALKSTRWRWPLFLSGLILLSQAFRLTSVVRDAATLLPLSEFHLSYPAWHLIFAPFCSVADALTVLGAQEDKVLLVTVAVLSLLLGGFRRGSLALLLFIGFVAWGALVPRPMGRLLSSDLNTVLVDFHSHTSYSHDGRPSFSPDANRRWHEAQGFNAAFITDHNLIAASQLAEKTSEGDWQKTNYRSLDGEEVSLKKTHLVILGNQQLVDNRPFDQDLRKVPGFIAAMHAHAIPVIASLPEYWLYHWYGEPFGTVEDFAKWGIDGFEILNSAPKAQDFPVASRMKIVDLCRHENRFMTGISDNHGYGYATAAWNALQIPGWQSLAPRPLEAAILKELATQRFASVQVIERIRYIPASTPGLLASPFMTLLLYWRMLSLLQCLSWIAWIWVIGAVAWRTRPPPRLA